MCYWRKAQRCHIRGSHESKHKIECQECGITFTLKENLTKHMIRFHLNQDLQVSCDICGKRFEDKKNMKKHMQIHNNNRIR
jgi:uncharacterized Zn-finger protein